MGINVWLRRRTAHIPVSAWSAQSQIALDACEFARALDLARRAVAYADRWLPVSHPSVVAARRALAAAYVPLDQVAEALAALKPALDTIDELSRADPETAVELLHEQGQLLECSGAYSDARHVIERALQLAEVASLRGTSTLASALAHAGHAEALAGRYSAAEAYYRRALDTLAPEDTGTRADRMRIALELAQMLQTMGHFHEAATMLNQVVEFSAQRLRRARTSPSYRGVALDATHTLNSAGVLFMSLGDLDQAEACFDASYQTSQALLGERHLDTVVDLHHLAQVAAARGDLRRALGLALQVYETRRSFLGERHSLVAATQSSLGTFYVHIADYAQAERHLTSALATQRSVWGDTHADIVATLANLTVLYETIGRHEDADRYGAQALTAARALYGDHHPDVATALNNLALARESLGEYDEAQEFFQRALQLRRSLYAETHPSVAQSLNNLAALLSARGAHEHASELYEEALILKRRLLPPAHASLATGLTNLAAVWVAQGRTAAATGLLHEAQQIQDVLLSVILSLASERQRLAYLAHARGEFHLFLSLLLSLVSIQPERAAEAFDLVLRRKGISAEALLAQREAAAASRNATLAAQWAAIASLRARIAEALVFPIDARSASAPQEQIEAWLAECETRESALAGEIPALQMTRRWTTITHERVCAAVPVGEALIEYVKYRPYDFKATPERGQPRWGPARYVAFVAHGGRPQSVAAVDLGSAAAIESAIDAHVSTLLGSPDSAARQSGAKDLPAAESEDASMALRTVVEVTTRHLSTAARLPSALEDSILTGQAVRSLIFDPLLGALGDTCRIWIAPDGTLSTLPFDILPLPGGQALLDVYDLSYLDVGRDVTRIARPGVTPAHEAVVLADPDFDLEVVPSSSAEIVSTAAGFPRLPGARREGERIAQRLGVTPLLGGDALKDTLVNLRSPHILHIATHGFFTSAATHPAGAMHTGENEHVLASAEDPGDDPSALQRALAQSGLALAGANTWMRQRHAAPGAGTGLLTAEDVAGMDLNGTELVVLSACETGLGLALTGEGVFGLRRAFASAGARTLIMSLWRIPDDPTRQLMDAFYRLLLAGEPRAQALHAAQRTLRTRYPHPYYWGAFVCLGDPRPLPTIQAVGARGQA